MTPSRFQAPLAVPLTAHKVCDGPPLAAIFSNLFWAL
jgi:hypothetical protein